MHYSDITKRLVQKQYSRLGAKLTHDTDINNKEAGTTVMF